MGYTTDFEGCMQVNCREVLFNLLDKLAVEEQQSNLESLNTDLFSEIIHYIFKDESPCVLHKFRLISKNIYYLCSKLNQKTLFNKVDTKTATLLNGLASTRHMIRIRYINGQDYGIDGQYYVGDGNDIITNQCFTIGNHSPNKTTYYSGKPICINTPGRVHPSLWNKWVFNVEKQCIEWNECEKFYHYIEWLIYIINNILYPRGYYVFGTITWQGEDGDDNGTIKISKKNFKSNIKIVRNYHNNKDENALKLEKFSKTKRKNIAWQFEIPYSTLMLYFSILPKFEANELVKFFDCINNKSFWVDNKENQQIGDLQQLCQKINVDYNVIRKCIS